MPTADARNTDDASEDTRRIPRPPDLQANLFAATDHHITRRYIIILEMTV